MRWKDFLYFPKGDRIAIVILSFLIIFSGGCYIYLTNFSFSDSESLSQKEALEKEFVRFADLMEDHSMQNLDGHSENTTSTTHNKLAKRGNISKLNPGETIDINTTTRSSIQKIPGIGAVLAQRIITYRDRLGGIISLEQLLEVEGVSIKKYSKILPYIIIKKRHKTIPINKVKKEQLSQHPYFEKQHIDAILNLRNKSKISSIDELAQNENFAPRDIERMLPYLSFR